MEWVIFFIIIIWIFSVISESKESKKTNQIKEINDKSLNKFNSNNYMNNSDIDTLLRELEDNKNDIKTKTIIKKNVKLNKKDKILDKYNIKYLYHMTHVDNLENILKYGLLSHHNDVVSHNIDNPEVNERRNFLEPVYSRNVHDYVPFYFNPRNAMLYVNRDIQDNLIILAFNRKLIYKNGSLFTDGNASVNGTRFFNNLNDLKQLDWKCLKSIYWNDFTDGRRKMMAEVLIPNKVSIKELKKIYCNNHDTKKQIKQITQQNNLNVKIEINEDLFF